MTPKLQQMPEEVQELRHEWPSLVGEIASLTEELERDFRFGRRITKTSRGYIMGGTIKGGSSSVWVPSNEEEFEAYERWNQREGLHQPASKEDYERLTALLDRHAIELTHEGGSRTYEPDLGYIYKLLTDVLERLPDFHLKREEFAALQLGGWGPDSAKGSAYDEGKVILYDFALVGARRTFLGLFLHELGHAHEKAWSDETKAELKKAHRTLTDHKAFFSVEFLLDGQSRKFYQRFVLNEFLAETYLAYTACGAALRTHMKNGPEPVRDAWNETYATFRRSFDGIEYE